MTSWFFERGVDDRGLRNQYRPVPNHQFPILIQRREKTDAFNSNAGLVPINLPSRQYPKLDIIVSSIEGHLSTCGIPVQQFMLRWRRRIGKQEGSEWVRGSQLQLRLRRAGGKATLDDACVWRQGNGTYLKRIIIRQLQLGYILLSI